MAHARRYEARGVARFIDGALLFLHRGGPKAHGPKVDVKIGVHDSGLDTFVRYPMPVAVSGGMKRRFPALAKAGAGL